MTQLSYPTNMVRAIEGNLADTDRRVDVVSRVALVSLPCAVVLVADATASLGDQGAKLPDADFTGSGEVEGVLIWDGGRVADSVSGNNYRAGDPLPVLRSGRMWVKPLQAVTRYAQAEARFQNGNEGKFDAPGGDTAPVPSCRYLDATTGALQLARIEINLPTTAAQ